MNKRVFNASSFLENENNFDVCQEERKNYQQIPINHCSIIHYGILPEKKDITNYFIF